MIKKPRVFTVDQEIQILRDSENMIVAEVCRKYEVTHSV